MARRRNKRTKNNYKRSTRVYNSKQSLRSPPKNSFIQKVLSSSPLTLSSPYATQTKKPKRPDQRQVVTSQRNITNGTNSTPFTTNSFPLNKTTQTLREKICKKRQQRKQVIHALNHSGKGGQKKPKLTQERNISCQH